MYTFERLNKRNDEVNMAKAQLEAATAKMEKAEAKADESKNNLLNILITDTATAYLIGMTSHMMRSESELMAVVGSYVNSFIRNEISDVMFSTQMSVDVTGYFLGIKEDELKVKTAFNDIYEFIDELTVLTMIPKQEYINNINYDKITYIKDVITNMMMWIG